MFPPFLTIVFEDNINLVELIDFAESRNHILYEENLSIIRKDKNETHINLTISPVFEDGLNSGSVISFEDLSDINKVKSTFKKLESINTKALVTYTVAGDPNLDISEQIISEIISSGADVIEIGAVSYTHLTLPTNREV